MSYEEEYAAMVVKGMSVAKMEEELAKCRAWIEGEENDGRLTTDSSAHLDMMQDHVDIFEAALARVSQENALCVVDR